MGSASPFAHIVAQLTPVTRPHLALADGLSKTAAMRQYLKHHGKATAADIATACGLGDTGRVMALLKADIAKGAIERSGAFYYWNDAFDQDNHERIQAAIRLLKAAGYKVTSPKP